MDCSVPPVVASYPRRRCHGAQNITFRIHSAKNCTIELINFGIYKFSASIEVSLGHFKKSTVAMANTLRTLMNKSRVELRNKPANLAAAYRQGAHVCVWNDAYEPVDYEWVSYIIIRPFLIMYEKYK